MVAVVMVALGLASSEGQVPIVADRPSVSISSLAVPPGRVQIETGVQILRTKPDLVFGASRLRTVSFPTKLRLGVIDGFEFHGLPARGS